MCCVSSYTNFECWPMYWTSEVIMSRAPQRCSLQGAGGGYLHVCIFLARTCTWFGNQTLPNNVSTCTWFGNQTLPNNVSTCTVCNLAITIYISAQLEALEFQRQPLYSNNIVLMEGLNSFTAPEGHWRDTVYTHNCAGVVWRRQHLQGQV